MSEHVVIVGGGLAGSQVALALRERGFAGQISLFGAETERPYQRPPLSKAFLKGEVSAAELEIRPASFLVEKRIDLFSNARVTSIDKARGQVEVSGRGPLSYDRLVLATGARNRRLGVPGENLQGIMSLRTLGDATRLRTRLSQSNNLVIVGAGFVGLEVAAVAAQLGTDVTVIERSGQALQRAVSRPMAEHLVARHRKGGVKFEFNATIHRIEAQAGSSSRRVCLDDGRIFDADVVLVAVGVEPSSELAEEAGLATGNGVLVDSALRSSDPNIYAVGDCANVLHGLYDGRRVRLESVQNANDQARCVAATLMGSTTIYSSVPWFWSDQWDIKLQIAGLSGFDHDHIIRGDTNSDRFSIARVHDGKVTALESVNHASEHMAARKIFKKPLVFDAARVGDTRVPLHEVGQNDVQRA